MEDLEVTRRIIFAVILAFIVLCGTSIVLIPKWVADQWVGR